MFASAGCRAKWAPGRDEKLTVSEVATIFGSWLAVLEKLLEPEDYHRVVPELRRVSSVGQLGDGAAPEAT